MKSRWISKELDHLNQYMKNLGVDIRVGNTESAKTNWGLASGIINGIIKRESKVLRGTDKMGVVIKWVYKKIKPLLREVGKEAIREYGREVSGKF